MFKRVCATALGLLTAGTLSATAQETCGGLYTVQSGDSLSLIADRHYKDVGQWTVIYRSNLDKISSPNSIRVGQQYRLPCINGLPVGLPGGQPVSPQTGVIAAVAPPQRAASAEEVAAARATRAAAGEPIRLLAGDGFKPFTNRLQLSSGLITDVVNRAMVAADLPRGHEFIWVNDRSAHLDPMLARGMVDLALPWKKPDCALPEAAKVCENYVFSEPMFEMLVVLFTAKDRPVTYNSTEDLAGMRVCGPLGHDPLAERSTGIGYLASAGARLQKPATAEECFARLMAGTADAVVTNEFTGRVALKDMGLTDQVELQLRRPLAIEGLYVVAHRANPEAEAMIEAINAGLTEMRESGEYLQVLDKHMSSIWAGL